MSDEENLNNLVVVVLAPLVVAARFASAADWPKHRAKRSDWSNNLLRADWSTVNRDRSNRVQMGLLYYWYPVIQYLKILILV